MKYCFAHFRHLAVVALLPACGGGGFTTTGGKGGHHAERDAAAEASGSGGSSGDGGGTGTGGKDSSGGAGSGGRQTGNGGRSSGGNDGTGGSFGTGGDGGANVDAGTAGADAGPGSGGTSNDSGPGSGGLGGAGGSCPDPTVWYVDVDQDGYGSTSLPTVKSCSPPPGPYSKVGGDCHDGNRDVHPQVTPQEKNFFGTPYKTAAGADSYDYDCSGVETGDPSQTKAGSCVISVGVCGGSGYQQSNRGGGTANPYCGSLKFQTCKGNTLCMATLGEVMTPYRCN
jgi:hypothetical protein